MASEVKNRLDVIGMGGRSLTLKIMKRDPTAPVEPAKVCILFATSRLGRLNIPLLI